MAIDGKITRTDDDAITGWIASLTFDVDITLTKNPHKAKDTHPDFEITTRTPRNRIIRIGSAWEQTSQAGNDYLSLSVMVNGQPSPRERPAQRRRPQRRIPPGPAGWLRPAKGRPRPPPAPWHRAAGEKDPDATHGKLRHLPPGRRLFRATNTSNLRG